MNLAKLLSVVAFSLATLSTLHAQQAVNVGGGSGGGPGPGVNPIRPAIALERIEPQSAPAETWVQIFGTFEVDVEARVTISQAGKWISSIQAFPGPYELNFQLDSLPSGDYQISVRQGGRTSNLLNLTVIGIEGKETVSIPAPSEPVPPEPFNDPKRPAIHSYEGKLIAGQRSLITGERFTSPVVVRLEQLSGEVVWARRIVPTSDGIIEFVPPSTYTELLLVVDNGQGIARVSVSIVPPPPPRSLEPKVMSFKFLPMLAGPMACVVKLDKPLLPDSILLIAKREDSEVEGKLPELILILPQSPDPEYFAFLEEEIAEFIAGGGILHRPATTYSRDALAFYVPESFAARGVGWLNTAKAHDEYGYVLVHDKEGNRYEDGMNIVIHND